MKLITTGVAALIIAAIAMPTLAEAKKRKRHHHNHWAGQRCVNGFNGVDCSTVSARDPDRRLSRQIITDFRRGVDTPGNGR